MNESDTPSPDDLAALIAELEIECARLRTVEAAAKEARAFLEGRRPGFAASYALDVLKAALTSGEQEAKAFPVIRGRWNARGAGRRKR